jgi:hypothetical protein
MAHFFFEKPLDSDILIIVLIGILPYAFGMLREDIITLYDTQKGRLAKKIIFRKSSLFILERLSLYMVHLSGITLIYSGLFILIDNQVALQYTVWWGFILLALSAVSSIIRETFERS